MAPATLLPVTLLYAGLLGLLMMVLVLRISLIRRGRKIAFGDGGDVELASRIRVFGNFTEYVPMLLILMGLLELDGAPVLFLHGLGILFVAARVLHALGLHAADFSRSRMRLRALGAALSMLCVLAASLAAVALWLRAA
jgi:uncharacterized membrane protein YecN with MAPEG domain